MVDGLQTICAAGSKVLRELNTGEAVVRRRSLQQWKGGTSVLLSFPRRRCNAAATSPVSNAEHTDQGQQDAKDAARTDGSHFQSKRANVIEQHRPDELTRD